MPAAINKLLRQLAVQKLEKQAAKLKEEGMTWVEVRPGIRWKLHNLARLQKTDAKKFAEQADWLATRLSALS